MNCVICAENICKTYLKPTPTTVLKGISLSVKEGESVAIMGKSGEGKSTLLHILSSLEEPSSGDVFLCGKNLKETDLPKLRRENIGFIFQSYNLLEEETLLDNLLLPIKIRRLPIHKGSFYHQRALSILQQVGLFERADFLVRLLSGGEKQRGAIARALISDPSILFADEPSGNLDRGHSDVIHHLLLEITKKQNKALVVVTHDVYLAKLCDTLYELKEGNLCKS